MVVATFDGVEVEAVFITGVKWVSKKGDTHFRAYVEVLTDGVLKYACASEITRGYDNAYFQAGINTLFQSNRFVCNVITINSQNAYKKLQEHGIAVDDDSHFVKLKRDL